MNDWNTCPTVIADAGQLPARQFGHTVVVDQNIAARRRLQQSKNAQQFDLPEPEGPDQRHELAAEYLQINVFEDRRYGGPAAKRLAEVAGFKNSGMASIAAAHSHILILNLGADRMRLAQWAAGRLWSR